MKKTYPEPAMEATANEIVEAFELLPNPEERLRHLMDLGKQYPPMDPAHRVEENLLHGCLSSLWLWPELRNGRCFFQMDADALTPKGTAALLCHFYNGGTPQAIASTEPDFLQDCGTARLISPSRQSGLGHLRAVIRRFALSHV